MIRKTVALLVALYAIGFAFAAFTAIRWPSLVAAGALLGEEASVFSQIQAAMNWRELGIHIGVPYLLAALCFHASATLVSRKGHGSVRWFVLGAMIGVPPLFLLDFAPGWWRSPDAYEQGVLFAGVCMLFLFSMVWELRAKRGDKNNARLVEEPAEMAEPSIVVAPPRHLQKPVLHPQTYAQPVMAAAPQVARPVRRKPVPAAIARQRACFAEYGRKQLARQQRPRA